MKKKIINKIKLNVNYQQYTIGEIITFADSREEQVEAWELYNSGIGDIVE